jgi:hypothetical protein
MQAGPGGTELLFRRASLAVTVTFSLPWIGILVINALLILPAAAARNLARSTAGILRRGRSFVARGRPGWPGLLRVVLHLDRERGDHRARGHGDLSGHPAGAGSRVMVRASA